MKRQWFNFAKAAADPSVIDIQIIDFIGDWLDDYWGFGVTAKSFIEQLSKLDSAVKAIRVHINSPGGDVFSALTIANALRDQQKTQGRTVETFVDGLAASAASVIAMAGAKVHMADNALMMIHQPWTGLYGNAGQLRKAANELDTITATITATYRWHSSLSHEDLVALMDAETWMDADAAIEKGLATDKVEGLRAAASLDPAALTKLNVPEQFKARLETWLKVAPTTPAPAPVADAAEVLSLCLAAGCSLEFASTLTAKKPTPEAARAAIDADKAARAAATTRANEIRAVCQGAGFEAMAEDYISGGMPLDRVKSQILQLKAKFDGRVPIDGSLPVNDTTGSGRQSRLSSPKDIYARRNAQPKE